jgi:hypothetical protein
MPLYVLLCVDGNGESQTAALCIVTNEEKETIASLMDNFLKRNEGSKVEVSLAELYDAV